MLLIIQIALGIICAVGLLKVLALAVCGLSVFWESCTDLLWSASITDRLVGLFGKTVLILGGLFGIAAISILLI